MRPICKPAQKPPDVTATCFLRCMCRCDRRWRATVERGLTSHSCPYRPVLAAVAGAADHVSMEACAGRIVPWASGARDEALQHCAGFASMSAPMASQGAGFDEPQQQLKQLALARGQLNGEPCRALPDPGEAHGTDTRGISSTDVTCVDSAPAAARAARGRKGAGPARLFFGIGCRCFWTAVGLHGECVESRHVAREGSAGLAIHGVRICMAWFAKNRARGSANTNARSSSASFSHGRRGLVAFLRQIVTHL